MHMRPSVNINSGGAGPTTPNPAYTRSPRCFPGTPSVSTAPFDPNTIQSPVLLNSRAVNLQSLGLSSLDGLEPNETLQVLNLQNNALTNFYGLPSMPAMKFLHCENNNISSFLGMSHQPLLEMISLEGNPIAFHTHFRLMALLSCGERLNIINHSVVTNEERALAMKLGGSGGMAAKCISYGWTNDFHPEPLTRQGYEELLVRLRQSYTNVCLALDPARSLGAYVQKQQQQPPAALAYQQHTRPLLSPKKSNQRQAPVASEQLTLQDLRRLQQHSVAAHVSPPPLTSASSQHSGAGGRPMSTASGASSNLSRSHTPALWLSREEVEAMSSFVFFAEKEHAVQVTLVPMAGDGDATMRTPSGGFVTTQMMLSPAASCSIHANGTIQFVHVSSPGVVFLSLNLGAAPDVILDESGLCVKIQPDASRKMVVCTLPPGPKARYHARAFFKCIMALKCTGGQLAHLYSNW